MKKLNELVMCPYDIDITGIKTNSKNVVSGDLFVCIHGLNYDRHDFIEEAIKKGALAIVVDRKVDYEIPTVVVENTNEALISICEKFYDDPCRYLKCIGITGTDGKTTTASMIYQLLSMYFPTAYLGTNGMEFNNETKPTHNTTPLPEELYSLLDQVRNHNGQFVAMEVSSEALLHHRVDHISFDVTVLTNITEDHLNIHKDLASYIKAKGKLFSLTKESGFVVLNRDDAHYEEIRQYCDKKKVYTYGEHEDSDFKIFDIEENDGTTFCLSYKQKTFTIQSPYVGRYNVWNLTAAIIVSWLLGKMELEDILLKIKEMKPIIGRGEFLTFGQNYTIVLDYAHTENAIKNVLSMVRSKHPKKIITVTGSAGGREKEKRKAMGKVALDKSDLVIFTMDDPRNENVDDIIEDLLSGTNKKNYLKVPDRKEAIYRALDMAKKDDAVVILGKGRDTYMAVGDKYLPYCDYDVISSYFKEVL